MTSFVAGLEAGSRLGRQAVDTYYGAQKGAREQEEYERQQAEYAQQRRLEEIMAKQQGLVGQQMYADPVQRGMQAQDMADFGPEGAAALQEGLQYGGNKPSQQRKFSELDYMQGVRREAGLAGIGGSKVNKGLIEAGQVSGMMRGEKQQADIEAAMEKYRDPFTWFKSRYDAGLGDMGQGKHKGTTVEIAPAEGGAYLVPRGAKGEKLGHPEFVDAQTMQARAQQDMLAHLAAIDPKTYLPIALQNGVSQETLKLKKEELKESGEYRKGVLGYHEKDIAEKVRHNKAAEGLMGARAVGDRLSPEEQKTAQGFLDKYQAAKTPAERDRVEEDYSFWRASRSVKKGELPGGLLRKDKPVAATFMQREIEVDTGQGKMKVPYGEAVQQGLIKHPPLEEAQKKAANYGGTAAINTDGRIGYTMDGRSFVDTPEELKPIRASGAAAARGGPLAPSIFRMPQYQGTGESDETQFGQDFGAG